MGKLLITIGLLLVLSGIAIHFLDAKMGCFGNLFGDIKIVKSNYRIYFPITSMIIVSIVVTLFLNFFLRFFK